MTRPTRRRRNCTALIVDVVGSRRFGGSRRAPLQTKLRTLVDRLNRAYRDHLLAPLAISRGDEFQGLLGAATVIPDLIWDMEEMFDDVELREGIGYGALDTRLGPNVLELDGPVLHLARAALDSAAATRRLGGVFAGFGEAGDSTLNGLARLLRRHRERMSRKQREVLSFLRRDEPQVAVAERLELTKQAVWDHARAAGADAYLEGESGWRVALRHFTSSEGAIE